jgi:hypothetical protein
MPAVSNRVALRFISEVTFGTTPTTPALKELRFTGESLNYNLSNVTSEEIRSDRMISDLVQVQSDAAGDLNVELSYDAYDDFIQAALAGTWSTPLAISATVISAANADSSFNRSSGSFVSDGVVVGQWIRVQGFANQTRQFWRVASVVALKIVVEQTGQVVTEAAGLTVTIKGSMLRNGTTKRSFTIQKHIDGITTPQYINFRGARIGQLQLNLQTGSILTGVFSVMALGATRSDSAIAGQTIVPAPTNDVMNAVGNVAEVLFDGVTSTQYFNNLALTLNNNLRAQDAIGSLDHIGIELAKLDVSGSLELYFDNGTEYQKFLSATAFSLAFRVQDATGNAYIFTFPRVKYESGEVVAGGLDQDVMLNAQMRAIRHAATNCMVQVDKFVGP